MKKLTMIVIGAGSRGRTYAGFAKNNPEMYEVVGVAEPIKERREFMIKNYPACTNNVYEDWKDILAVPKFADVAVIATMDRMHLDPALKAIELGYDILLEKPMAPTAEESKKICEAAEKKGTKILVCHVLRYTHFFKALKQVIDSGKIGKVMSINHEEGVGNIHQSHSFVRGNWGNEEASSFMLLQKSCHDMDILQWLLGEKCVKAQSFGSLKYFTPANRPEGAPDYCLDGCPHADKCRYNVEKIYFGKNEHGWMRNTITAMPDPSEEERIEALKKGRHGRCVFACDNNVVDHQVVNLEFESGATVSFTMNAFNLGGRVIHIMGTDGEIHASMSSDTFTVSNFDTSETETVKINDMVLDESIASGHGGGDAGIMLALHDLIAEGKTSKSVCDIRTSYENHIIAFAAEDSRKNGTVVNISEYEKNI